MQRPTNIKDKNALAYIEYLESEVKSLEAQLKSPYAESYLAIKKIVDAGNKQIMEEDFDIFDEASEKKSAMIQKFLNKTEDYSKQMEYFKSMMSPADAIKIKKVVKEEGVEQFLKNQDAKA